MKRIVLSIAFMAAFIGIKAQENNKLFNHLDLGLTLGTTGIGLDAAMPISNVVKLRAGFEVMPRFNYNMHFFVESYDPDAPEEQAMVSDDQISKMSELLYNLTGFKVDQTGIMECKPTMWNFKFMVDVYPFKNKHWHVTAGFHWGPSKIAEAVNAIEDSPSLFAVGMYNHLYDVAYKDWVLDIPTPIITTETTGPIYLTPIIEQKLIEMGQMGIPVGTFTHDVIDAKGNLHQEGDMYYMLPNENSMVYVDARTNSFKPYLGFGYEGRLIKGNDNYHVGFDAGVMFWGGTPSIITHEGIDLAKDIDDLVIQNAKYIDFVKGVKAYPVLNFRITRRIF